ncbi:MAG: type I 3-dehydroquinate dehydratase [Spirochaetaceae bacterium]|jgi:3-dehydroquinate dehydratase/shikimate dehydrogenase|nr:type I 3-dehydroquinate dehydratase [Spirochaetaceae bacterium]
MTAPKVCLCLTGGTLNEDLALVEKYRPCIDMAELRADFLQKDERLHIRRFPELAGIPCILTIRRKIDGGKFLDGEANRSMLFARALAFADPNPAKNFAFVDFEEDFFVPSLQDAALAFGTRIIRSRHSMTENIPNIAEKIETMRVTGYEIPKISCRANSLAEVTNMFREAKKLGDSEHILCCMGPYGVPARILAAFLNSYLTYSTPEENAGDMGELYHVDPRTLEETYRFRSIRGDTKIFGVTGFPLVNSLSPEIHNTGYKRHNMNAVYIPLRSDTIEEALEFAEALNMSGLSVTVPHKEAVIGRLASQSQAVQKIQACNTLVRTPEGWHGRNTDAAGLERALQEFVGARTLSGVKVAIIGAGGAAKAAAFAVKRLRGRACVFNRTVIRAKKLAEMYGFKWAFLDIDSYRLLSKYSDLIIQTTSKGMDSTGQANHDNDPLYFYTFSGKEALYDLIYTPLETPLMARARAAGCRVEGGYSMLKYQAHQQFEYFTGEPYGPHESK